MKYCMRRSDVSKGGGCCVWRLNDDLTFIDACTSWPDHRRGVWRLHQKTELGGWREIAKVAMPLVNVPIHKVRGLADGQIAAIRKDIEDGRISRYA